MADSSRSGAATFFSWAWKILLGVLAVAGGIGTAASKDFRRVMGDAAEWLWPFWLVVSTTPEAVALGHLATHVDDLAIPGKLPKDSANSQGLQLLNWSFSSVRRCRWGSCLRDLLFVVHARPLGLRRWQQSGYGR